LTQSLILVGLNRPIKCMSMYNVIKLQPHFSVHWR